MKQRSRTPTLWSSGDLENHDGNSSCGRSGRRGSPPAESGKPTGSGQHRQREEITIRDVAELIAEIVGFQGRIEQDLSKPDGTPRNSATSVESNRLAGTLRSLCRTD